MSTPTPWPEARRTAYELGLSIDLPTVELPLDRAVGHTLAAAPASANPLPAFDTVAMDGYAVRGEGPAWDLLDYDQLAGHRAAELPDGRAVRIATGAQLPPKTEGIVRLEDSTVTEGTVSGPHQRDWRETGDEIALGEELLPAGTPVSPAAAGFAAAAGLDRLTVFEKPTAAFAVFGDELIDRGPARDGKIRDSLGPMLPAMLEGLGATASRPVHVEDTPEAHYNALNGPAPQPTILCTTGGTMHGPVDYLHPTLKKLGAEYLIDTVAVRPGFPMLLARTPNGIVCGLPGNPQSAVISVATIVAPLIAGLLRRPLPELGVAAVADDIPGRGDCHRLALVDDFGRLIPHHGSAMLRGVATARGFAVVEPHTNARRSDALPLVPMPGRTS
ncbi:molybdopterin molybdotransferase MoeA [Salininema proteolyticum]|uniref:Molybdopterin molybdenumtransferase n=1 Tax=Salininema proteolyticum TaxID=1607685 RepID=A0ABV8U587_9ACTN